MNDRISRIAMLTAATGFIGFAFGMISQDTTADKRLATSPTSTISVGDNINVARKIFIDQDVAHGRTAFSFARGPEDEDYITANIDPAHMTLCLWFSKTNQDIIRIQVLISPWPRQGKAANTWLPVTSYQVNRDGTFVLSFPKPPTISEIEERRKKLMENAEFPKPTFGKSNSDK